MMSSARGIATCDQCPLLASSPIKPAIVATRKQTTATRYQFARKSDLPVAWTCAN